MFENVATQTSRTLYALVITGCVVALAWLCLAKLPLLGAVLGPVLYINEYGGLAISLLVLLSLFFIMPLYFTAVFATRTLNEVFQFPPPFWFGSNIGQNFANIANVFPPFRPIINSLLVAVPKTRRKPAND